MTRAHKPNDCCFGRNSHLPPVPNREDSLEVCLLIWTREDRLDGSLAKCSDIFSIQVEMLRCEVVLLRERAAKDTYIIRLPGVSHHEEHTVSRAERTLRATGTLLCRHVPKWWSE